MLDKPALLLADCRCVICLTGTLTRRGDLVECVSCGQGYDVVDEIPYLLSLEARDFPALVEIVAEYDRKDYVAREPFDGSLADLILDYDKSNDRGSFLMRLPSGLRTELTDRHEQWKQIDILCRPLTLAGASVLVLGAGFGFDAHLLERMGAQITAVDLNPQTNSLGRIRLPTARWIGALGRHLPFADRSFDHVFISASLHHVLDVSATIREMIRVVKVGGSVVTTNDSFMADAVTDEDDARFWNDHPAVLNGINENRPRLKAYLSPLFEYRDILDVEFWTLNAFDVWSEKEQRYRHYPEPTKWDIWKDHTILAESSGGGVFMRLSPTAPPPRDRTPAGTPLISVSQIASWIGNKTRAMAEIGRLTPPEWMMPPFPGKPGNTKFQLLNGWRWANPNSHGREAVRRARWYLSRTIEQTVLEVVTRPHSSDAKHLVRVIVDGCERARGENHFAIDISSVSHDTPFCVEIALTDLDMSFEDSRFVVERLLVNRPTSDTEAVALSNEVERLKLELASQDNTPTTHLSNGRIASALMRVNSELRQRLKAYYLFRRLNRLLRKH